MLIYQRVNINGNFRVLKWRYDIRRYFVVKFRKYEGFMKLRVPPYYGWFMSWKIRKENG
jgi:hypothetical protein